MPCYGEEEKQLCFVQILINLQFTDKHITYHFPNPICQRQNEKDHSTNSPSHPNIHSHHGNHNPCNGLSEFLLSSPLPPVIPLIRLELNYWLVSRSCPQTWLSLYLWLNAQTCCRFESLVISDALFTAFALTDGGLFRRNRCWALWQWNDKICEVFQCSVVIPCWDVLCQLWSVMSECVQYGGSHQLSVWQACFYAFISTAAQAPHQVNKTEVGGGATLRELFLQKQHQSGKFRDVFTSYK